MPRACSSSIQSDLAWRYVDRARIEQQFFRQRGFPGVRVGNDGKGASPQDFSPQIVGRGLFNRQGHNVLLVVRDIDETGGGVAAWRRWVATLSFISRRGVAARRGEEGACRRMFPLLAQRAA